MASVLATMLFAFLFLWLVREKGVQGASLGEMGDEDESWSRRGGVGYILLSNEGFCGCC
jgi:hypothetical protein